MINTIVFDMDETLMDESSYVLSGMSSVSLHLNKKYNLNNIEIYEKLKDLFIKDGRERIFNKLFEKINMGGDLQDEIDSLVMLYRHHKPKIDLYDGVESWLRYFKYNGIKMGLLTDGLPIMQKNKVDALGLEKYFDKIIYSWEIDCPKPSEKGIKHILKELDSSPEESLMVGDNPINDIEPALKIGMKAIRVLKGRFSTIKSKPDFMPDFESESIDQIFTRIKEYV